MSAAEEQEENHWPGFVDALSTIVMVVTFLLIILAVAIFVLSLNIAKTHSAVAGSVVSPDMPAQEEIKVASNPTTMDLTSPDGALMRSDNALVMQFSGTTLSIDDRAKAAMADYFEKNQLDPAAEESFAVAAYFDAKGGGYAKQQRIAYYRVMAVRNQLINQGFDRQQVAVFVREAPTAKQIDTVEISKR